MADGDYVVGLLFLVGAAFALPVIICALIGQSKSRDWRWFTALGLLSLLGVVIAMLIPEKKQQATPSTSSAEAVDRVKLLHGPGPGQPTLIGPVEATISKSAAFEGSWPPNLSDVVESLKANAADLGANAVVGVEYSRSASDLLRHVLTARGTAVFLQASDYETVVSDAESEKTVPEMALAEDGSEGASSEPSRILVALSDEDIREFTPEELKAAVYQKKVNLDTRVRLLSPEGDKDKGKDGDWIPFSLAARKIPSLIEIMYPIRYYAEKGLWTGAVVGYILKALETTISVGRHVDIGLALLLATFLAAPFFKGVYGWGYALVIGFVYLPKYGIENPWGMWLGAAIGGSLLVGPIGAVVGAIRGHLKAKNSPVPIEIMPETRKTLALAITIPVLWLCVWVPAYIYWNVVIIKSWSGGQSM